MIVSAEDRFVGQRPWLLRDHAKPHKANKRKDPRGVWVVKHDPEGTLSEQGRFSNLDIYCMLAIRSLLIGTVLVLDPNNTVSKRRPELSDTEWVVTDRAGGYLDAKCVMHSSKVLWLSDLPWFNGHLHTNSRMPKWANR